MKVLAIPDIHLKPWIFDRSEQIDRSTYDFAIILGDLVDDWGKGNDLKLYEETLDRAAKFATDHPDSLWCYGNHDVSYLWDYMESGYSLEARVAVIDGISKLEQILGDRYRFIHKVDNTLFSHAGLTESFAIRASNYVISDIDDLLARINQLGSAALWRDDSPLWARPQSEHCRMFKSYEYYQVVGHTPVEKPLEEGGILSLDLFSTYRNGSPFGNETLYIIDCCEKKYYEAK